MIPRWTRRQTHPRTRVACVLIAAGSLAACGGGLRSNDVALVTAPPVPTAAPPPATAPPNPDCQGFDGERVVASYPADAAPAQAPALDRIRANGKLVAGVSADTLLFGARDPLTGRLEGLDIDLVRALAARIFPGQDVDKVLQLRVITYAQRLPLLESQQIDVVAHTMTINCARWNRIAFSTEYYSASQRLLVKRDETATEIEDLPNDSRICVPAGGTSEDNIKQLAPEGKTFQAPAVDDITECLVLMQQGQADAVLSDDTVVLGMAAQDPYTKVVGRPLSAEPYGMGFNANDVDLVQVANAMLEELRTSGELKRVVVSKGIATEAGAVIPPGNTDRPLPNTIAQ
jgi:polar amino acid transport system substrate-binding protein